MQIYKSCPITYASPTDDDTGKNDGSESCPNILIVPGYIPPIVVPYGSFIYPSSYLISAF